ncbi:MAG: hypothetical protein JWM39_416 [Parcubacteria group bacterium]|nr:hypothetical protein [Parcubacteria group bacterium]
MRTRRILSFGNFFASAYFFLIVYVLGPYLAMFMPASLTGFVISFGAVVTLIVFPFIPKLVRRYGAQQLALGFSLLQAFILLCLALSPTPFAAIVLAALTCAIAPLLAYQLDILVEATVENENSTGRIRTAFLTAGNTALLVAPLIIGTLLDGGDRYDRIFFVASLSLVPFILLMFGAKLPHGLTAIKSSTREAIRNVMKDSDLRAIAASMLMLQTFYQFAQLYIPLYLHTVLGIPWSELGWVFALMLAPFVLVEYPAGILADTKLGDRALLIAGFIIMGTAFALIAYVTASTSILIILLILFISRVGAALVEAMTEGHFFRRVSERDADTVSVFRMMRPLSALIAPVVGSIFLLISTYQIFFVCMGLIVMLVGMITATHVRSFRPVRQMTHVDANRV